MSEPLRKLCEDKFNQKRGLGDGFGFPAGIRRSEDGVWVASRLLVVPNKRKKSYWDVSMVYEAEDGRTVSDGVSMVDRNAALIWLANPGRITEEELRKLGIKN